MIVIALFPAWNFSKRCSRVCRDPCIQFEPLRRTLHPLARTPLALVMVAYEETSSLQVLGTVTADAVVTVSLALFSFNGSLHDALFPPGYPQDRDALAAAMWDILLMLAIRASISVASVTGAKACTRPCGIFCAFVLHSAMAIWCGSQQSRRTLFVHAITYKSCAQSLIGCKAGMAPVG